ncbi:tail fiber assembly protein [Salmonella enterica subsp. enterica serovar Give]|nr:tail fiber assembly protein [Salmonella enterica subsp. enterica serovar Give]
MQHCKNFTETLDLTPVQQEMKDTFCFRFIHDENGVDWYILQKKFLSDSLKMMYDKNGLIIYADRDVTKLFPLNCSVVEFADKDIPADFQPGKFTYSDGVITPVQIDYVALATAERNRRMSAVTARINELVEAQDDGDITDKELAELAELREVRTNLRRLNLTNAPHIEWPEVPEDVA